MIDLNPLSIKDKFETRNNNIEISFSEIGLGSFFLDLPPIDEIRDIKELYKTKQNVSSFLKYNKETKEKYLKEKLHELQKYSSNFRDSPKYLYHLYSIYNALGESENANNALSEAIKKSNKKNTFLLNKKAAFDLKSGNISSGRDLLLKTSKKNYIAKINLSLFFLQNRDIASAIKIIKKAIKEEPLRFESYFVYCVICIIEKKYLESIKLAKIAIDLNDKSATLHYLLGLSYLLISNRSKAEKNLLISLSHDPLYKNALILFSDIVTDKNLVNYSKVLLEKYINFDEKSSEIWDRLARNYFREGKFDKTIKLLKHQASIDDSLAVWNNFAVVYYIQGNFEKSEKYFKYALSKCQSNPPAIILLNYSNILYSRKRFVDIAALHSSYHGITNLNELDTIYYIEFLFKYVQSLFRIDRYEEAINHAENILNTFEEVNNNLINIKNFLIYMYSYDSTNYGKLESIINSILKIEINHLPKKTKLRVMNNILYSLIVLNQISEAKNLFNSILNEIDDDIFLNATYGLLKIKFGDVKAGEFYYKRSIKMTKNTNLRNNISTKLNIELAKYYLNNSNKRKALQQINSAIKTKNDNKFLIEEARNLRVRILEMTLK